MSIPKCALSSNTPEKPVISAKTGHVFDKEIIEKYIDDTGQCPITGDKLEKKDLIDIKDKSFNQQIPLNSSTIPSTLENLKNEWDSIRIENNKQRKQFEEVKNQLAHSCYQNDASLRLISKLVHKCDQALKELKNFKLQSNHKIPCKMNQTDDANMSEIYDTESTDFKLETVKSELDPGLVRSLVSKSVELKKQRKSRKKPKDYFKLNDLKNLNESYCFSLQSYILPGITCLDIKKDNCNYICTGDCDGKATLFDNLNKIIVLHLINENNESRVLEVEFTLKGVLISKENGMIEYWTIDYLSKQVEFKQEIRCHQGVSASVHPLHPYMISASTSRSWAMWNFETGSNIIETQIEEGHDLTAVKIHPDGLILATGCSDGSVILWDIKSQKKILKLKETSSEITKLSFSGKGIHLSSVSHCKSSAACLWDINKLTEAAKLLTTGKDFMIKSLEIDSFGSFIVSTVDNKLNFYRTLNTNKIIATIDAHEDVINQAKFADDGSYIASVSEDGHLKTFTINTVPNCNSTIQNTIIEFPDFVTKCRNTQIGLHDYKLDSEKDSDSGKDSDSEKDSKNYSQKDFESCSQKDSKNNSEKDSENDFEKDSENDSELDFKSNSENDSENSSSKSSDRSCDDSDSNDEIDDLNSETDDDEAYGYQSNEQCIEEYNQMSTSHLIHNVFPPIFDYEDLIKDEGDRNYDSSDEEVEPENRYEEYINSLIIDDQNFQENHDTSESEDTDQKDSEDDEMIDSEDDEETDSQDDVIMDSQEAKAETSTQNDSEENDKTNSVYSSQTDPKIIYEINIQEMLIQSLKDEGHCKDL